MELGLGLALPININSTKGGFDLNDNIIQRSKKRSFDKMFKHKDLNDNIIQRSKKRSFDKMFKHKDDEDNGDDGCSVNLENPHCGNKSKKALVGWPPIKCRRNNVNERPNNGSTLRNIKPVKVKMEGVAIGRKIDPSLLNSYQALHCALSRMFPNQFSGGSNWEEDEGSRKERNYKVTYEDDEGDWMLVGDVPWESFIQSVKQLKIFGDQSN